VSDIGHLQFLAAMSRRNLKISGVPYEDELRCI
jgi:hypothetical protein